MTREAPVNPLEDACWDIITLIRRRRFNEARPKARKLYEDAAGNPGYQGRALMYLLETRVKQGDFSDIDELVSESISLTRESEFKASAPRALRIYASGLLMMGRIDEARNALEDAVALEPAIPTRTEFDRALLRRAQLENRIRLGFCELAAFDHKRAEEYCRAAEPFSIDGETDPWNKGELKLLAALVKLPSNPARAAQEFHEAMRMFSSSDDPIDYDRARALDLWGRATGNVDLVNEAISLYLQMPNIYLARMAEDWIADRGEARAFAAVQFELSDDELVRRADVTSEVPIIVAGLPQTRELLIESARIGYHAGVRPILVIGESGTGKETVARVIHNSSPRATKQFVVVNCAAIAESLFLAELFGYRKGAYTGASESRPGYLDKAKGGTLFLDEVHLLSPQNQGALLRVIQERTYTPVGGREEIPADLHLICATNRDIWRMAQEGAFADDLLRRIAKICIQIKPLRERPEEISVLANHIVATYAAEKNYANCHLDPAAHDLLRSYSWPGNYRTLDAVLWRAVFDAGDRVLGVEALEHAASKMPGVDLRKIDPVPVPPATSDEFDTLYREVRAFLDSSRPKSLSENAQMIFDKMRALVFIHAKEVCGSDSEAARRCQMKLSTFRDHLFRARELLGMPTNEATESDTGDSRSQS